MKTKRTDAIANGDSRYFPNEECYNRHKEEWYTLPNQKKGRCVECHRIAELHRSSDPTRRKAKRKQARERYASDLEFREHLKLQSRKRAGYPKPTRPEPSICECCGKPCSRKSLNLDHDHETGKFRGWLCIRCNVGIGHLGDTRERLLQALDYLEAGLSTG